MFGGLLRRRRTAAADGHVRTQPNFESGDVVEVRRYVTSHDRLPCHLKIQKNIIATLAPLA